MQRPLIIHIRFQSGNGFNIARFAKGGPRLWQIELQLDREIVSKRDQTFLRAPTAILQLLNFCHQYLPLLTLNTESQTESSQFLFLDKKRKHIRWDILHYIDGTGIFLSLFRIH